MLHASASALAAALLAASAAVAPKAPWLAGAAEGRPRQGAGERVGFPLARRAHRHQRSLLQTDQRCCPHACPACRCTSLPLPGHAAREALLSGDSCKPAVSSAAAASSLCTMHPQVYAVPLEWLGQPRAWSCFGSLLAAPVRSSWARRTACSVATAWVFLVSASHPGTRAGPCAPCLRQRLVLLQHADNAPARRSGSAAAGRVLHAQGPARAPAACGWRPAAAPARRRRARAAAAARFRLGFLCFRVREFGGRACRARTVTSCCNGAAELALPPRPGSV